MTKRTMDILGALIGLALLWPVLLACVLAVLVFSGRPAFFCQWRVGAGGRTFRILKLRTMAVHPGARPSVTAAGDTRITGIGRILRRTKLDELPQLLNVLAGQMSLVGPRPETPDLLADYTPPDRAAYLALKPGITDLSSLAFADEENLLANRPDPRGYYLARIVPIKMKLVRQYLAQQGMVTDLSILWATVRRVLA